MDIFGKVSAAVFTTGQSHGLNVDDMASAFGLASADIMTLERQHPCDCMVHPLRMVLGADDERTLHMRLARGAPMCTVAQTKTHRRSRRR